MNRLAVLILAFSPLAWGGFAYTANVTFAPATGSTQSNITLAFTGSDLKLRTTANSGQITHTVTRVGVTVPADLVFTSDASCATTTGYTWGIEQYDASAGTIKGWVLVSSLTAGASVAPNVCIGNSDVTTYQGGSQGAEFDSSTKGAWHTPNGSTLSVKDFSSSANDGTAMSVTSGAGKIGGGASFPISGAPAISAPISAMASSTISMWFSYADNTSYYNGFWTLTGGSNAMNVRATNNGRGITFTDNGGAGFGPGNVTVDLRSGAFHRVDITVSPTTAVFFLDGTLIYSAAGTYAGTAAGNILIGNLFNISGDSWYGVLDEIRISGTSRSANWIATEYANQNSVPAIGVFTVPIIPIYTFTGPAGGRYGVASSTFTLTSVAPLFPQGTITLSDGNSGGAFVCSTGATGTSTVAVGVTGLTSATCTWQPAHRYDTGARTVTISPASSANWPAALALAYRVGYDCASAAAADWETNATWTGCGGSYPQDDDTATLGHVVTVSTAVTVGVSPATGGSAAIDLGTVGAVTIVSGGILKTRGDTLYNPAGSTTAVTVQGGGIWEFDASQAATPASQHYVFGQTGHFGKRAFVVSASSGSHGIVRSNAGGGVGQFSTRGFTRGGGLISSYGDFLRIGDASHSGWLVYTDSSNAAYAIWNVSHSTFTSCGLLDWQGTVLAADTIFIHDTSVHVGSLGGTGVFGTILNNNSTPGAGTREIKQNVFDITVSSAFQDGGFTFSGNYYGAAMAASAGLACTARAGEFYRFTLSETLAYMTVHCDISNSYIFQDLDLANSKPIMMDAHVATNLIGVINGLGGSGAGADSGELWWSGGVTPVTPLTYGMYNTIMLPDATGHSYQEGGSMTTTTGTQLVKAEHNIWFGGTGPPGINNPGFGFLDLGEGGNTPAGSVTSFKGNIFWADTATNIWYKLFDIGMSATPTQDYCSPANCDYNGGFNFTAVCPSGGGQNFDCSHLTNQGRGYAAKFSATPGVHDVTADPVFVDYQRTAELYPSKGLGITRTAWNSGATYAIGDFVAVGQSTVYWSLPVNFRYTNGAYEGTACSSANPKPGSGTNWRSCWEWEILYDLRTGVASGTTIISDMMAWVRAGWTPTNAAYRVTFPGDTNAVSNLGATQMRSVSVSGPMMGIQ